jgi:hypothetical protein
MRITGGSRITGGVRLSGTPTGGGGGSTYSATQAMENSGSNGIHIPAFIPWGASVPVGATIAVDGMGTYTVINIAAPGDPGNFSANWFFSVTPATSNFPGGIGLTFTW